MLLRSIRNNGLLITVFAGFTSLAFGCIINGGGDTSGDGPNQCGESLLDHNYVGQDGLCYCDSGYTWCNPNNDADLTCCEAVGNTPNGGNCGNNSSLAGDGLCYCDQGYDWCSNTGLDCCPLDPKQPTETDAESVGGTTAGTTGSGTSAGPDCNPEPPPDGACDDGTVWCTHDESCGGGGDYYECISGAWQLQGKDVLDTTCSFDDPSWQSFGCVDDAEMDQVVILCGNGSGAACTSDSCQGTETLLTCDYGLQTAMLDCLTICNDSSFDNGECGEQDGVDQCLCFDDTTNTSDSDSDSSTSTSDSSGSTG
ncbi:MAG: hypothetical protein H6713_19455 [Myxococcales bacterium]|nr:hypothetical protein [Myxococcales bacterium]MCB9752146.1 hypothetical protein [Myxococcales bacterium]